MADLKPFVRIATCTASALALAIAAITLWPGLPAGGAEAKKAAPAAPPPGRVLAFEKVKISDETYESAAVFDVNNDGQLDIVCGAWWYPGPKFDKKCPVAQLKPAGDYYNDFATIPIDVNGDGYMDFVTGGWFDKTLRWRENPKGDPAKEWPEHVISTAGSVECAMGYDLDGDGRLEIVANLPGVGQRDFHPEVECVLAKEHPEGRLQGGQQHLVTVRAEPAEGNGLAPARFIQAAVERDGLGRR